MDLLKLLVEKFLICIILLLNLKLCTNHYQQKYYYRVIDLFVLFVILDWLIWSFSIEILFILIVEFLLMIILSKKFYEREKIIRKEFLNKIQEIEGADTWENLANKVTR
jgi:hypothetical protein